MVSFLKDLVELEESLVEQQDMMAKAWESVDEDDEDEDDEDEDDEDEEDDDDEDDDEDDEE